MELKTPLYDAHVKAGGKIVPFGGYLLPVQYEAGVIKEHMAVRTQAGLFDVSHMGEVLCEGKDALANIQMILTNNFDNMVDGQARYSPMCNEHGGTVDDLIVYKHSDDHYFIVVNAANKDKDYQWMLNHQFGEVKFTDVSAQYAQLALQGPKAMDILRKLTAEENIPQKYYHTLLENGKEEGLIPCGLGARDTLRMEAAMPLYGHEMDDDVSPLETGLGFAVKMKKDDFIGKKALEEHAELTRKRVGLEVIGRGIIREHQDVYADGKVIGHTTSGTKGPFIDKAVGMALLETAYTDVGTKLQVDVRGRMVDVEVVALPFYKRAK